MNGFDFLSRGALLAPMAGVTDMPFRVICHEMGCPMATSEMVSAKGFLLAPKGNRATAQLLAVSPREEGAVALQLFGHEPEIMARAAEELTRDGRYAMLDINMGCPVPKIVGNGEGSALMREPVRAAELIAAVAGQTALGKSMSEERRLELRKEGKVAFPEDLGIDPATATRDRLAAQNLDDIVEWSHGLYKIPAKFKEN